MRKCHDCLNFDRRGKFCRFYNDWIENIRVKDCFGYEPIGFAQKALTLWVVL